MDLTALEQRLISDLFAQCGSITSEREFADRIYPILRHLIPHQYFSCGIICTHDLYVHFTLNVNFPSQYLDAVTGKQGLLQSPVATEWTRTRRPQYHEVKALCDLPTATRTWRETTGRLGITNIAAHGFIDGGGALVTYVTAANLSGSGQQTSVQSLLDIVLPPIHTAVTGITSHQRPRLGDQASLSRRERDVLALLCDGADAAKVAEIMEISPWTIKAHVHNIVRKLSANNRCHAVAIALQHGLVRVAGRKMDRNAAEDTPYEEADGYDDSTLETHVT